jgi:hypothetical protein
MRCGGGVNERERDSMKPKLFRCSTLRSSSIVFFSDFFFFPGSLPSSFAACKGPERERERKRERDRQTDRQRQRETGKGRWTETNRQIEWEDGIRGKGGG